mgnify:CR=1 FL=1
MTNDIADKTPLPPKPKSDPEVGRITRSSSNNIFYIGIDRPEKLNAIDDDVPGQLQDAVHEAENDSDIHVIILSGKGKGFCGGYDLGAYAENQGQNNVYQGEKWDPLIDYKFFEIRCLNKEI